MIPFILAFENFEARSSSVKCFRAPNCGSISNRVLQIDHNAYDILIICSMHPIIGFYPRKPLSVISLRLYD